MISIQTTWICDSLSLPASQKSEEIAESYLQLVANVRCLFCHRRVRAEQFRGALPKLSTAVYVNKIGGTPVSCGTIFPVEWGLADVPIPRMRANAASFSAAHAWRKLFPS
jgi:hypothetical protein